MGVEHGAIWGVWALGKGVWAMVLGPWAQLGVCQARVWDGWHWGYKFIILHFPMQTLWIGFRVNLFMRMLCIGLNVLGLGFGVRGCLGS